MNIPRYLSQTSHYFTPALLVLLIFLLIKPAHSQNTPSSQRDVLLQERNYLLDKSQRQKNWAWVTMGLSIPVTIGGVAGGILGGNDVLFMGGLVMVVGSIVLFTSSNKNQTKALKMDLGFIHLVDPTGQITYFNQMRSSSYLLKKPDVIPGIRVTYSF